MITGLDHVLIVCPSIDDGEVAYSKLLGREPDWRSHDPGGSATVIFQLENPALEIMSPTGGGPLARRLPAASASCAKRTRRSRARHRG